MIQQEIIIAGFGGQGILSAGRLIAYAGMLENKKVSWLPSYGPEMRGGTANCHVVISDEEIGSPILNKCTSLIVLNGPSLQKFEKLVEADGIIITDSSLVEDLPIRNDIQFISIPATRMAIDMGNPSFAIIFLIGKLLAKTNIISSENFEKALESILPEKYHYLIPEEMKALETGINY